MVQVLQKLKRDSSNDQIPLAASVFSCLGSMQANSRTEKVAK
jgi:hypothetical protein